MPEQDKAKISFETGNIYDQDFIMGLSLENYDCIVLRSILHHLEDPGKALANFRNFQGTLLIHEPNGLNLVLKILERTHPYHRAHHEKSFSHKQIHKWLADMGFAVERTTFLNCVPMFSPDWLAKTANAMTPLVEKIPLVRMLACGQQIITAKKNAKRDIP